MKILFTGATGVIGRASLPRLIGAGHEVTAVYRSPDDRQWLEDVGARAIDVDLFDSDVVALAVSGNGAFREATGWAPSHPSAADGRGVSVEQNRAQGAH